MTTREMTDWAEVECALTDIWITIDPEAGVGNWRMCGLLATYEQLVDLFGEPIEIPGAVDDCAKITHYWPLRYEMADGSHMWFTIRCYKTVAKETEWWSVAGPMPMKDVLVELFGDARVTS